MDWAADASAAAVERGEPLDDLIAKADIFEEAVVIEGMSVRTAGLAVRYDGELIVGSAASIDESPLPRARAELAERLAIVAALRRRDAKWPVRDQKGTVLGFVATSEIVQPLPDHSPCRWARTSGAAADDAWPVAARRAHLEALERDRVMRSWFGEVIPKSIEPPVWFRTSLRRIYDVEAFSFDPPEVGGFRVAGVFAFPKRSADPFVCGFACGQILDEALRSSARECLQRLAFLWGESLPSGPVVPSATPDFHQDYYLFPGNQNQLRCWLRGEHSALAGVLNVPERPGPMRFVDFTPRWREGNLSVAKAVGEGFVPLSFGLGHPFISGEIPPEFRVHPIA